MFVLECSLIVLVVLLAFVLPMQKWFCVDGSVVTLKNWISARTRERGP